MINLHKIIVELIKSIDSGITSSLLTTIKKLK